MAEGVEPDGKVPMDYSVYKWRRAMGVNHFEALITPPDRILRDLEYVYLEEKYGPKQEQK